MFQAPFWPIIKKKRSCLNLQKQSQPFVVWQLVIQFQSNPFIINHVTIWASGKMHVTVPTFWPLISKMFVLTPKVNTHLNIVEQLYIHSYAFTGVLSIVKFYEMLVLAPFAS